MRRAWMCLLLLLVLVPGTALAGGGGIIQLYEPLDQVKAGDVPIYFQALQHGETALNKGEATVTGTAPDGQTVSVTAALDPSPTQNTVWKAVFPFKQTGAWTMKIEFKHPLVQFPPLTFTVQVPPAVGGAGTATGANPATGLNAAAGASSGLSPVGWYGIGAVGVLAVAGGVLLRLRRRPS